MLEYLPQQVYGVISRRRLADLLGVKPQDEAWNAWTSLLSEAVREHILEASQVRMSDGNEVAHYRPHWSNQLVQDTILGWAVLTGTIRELTRKTKDVPLTVVLDHLAPFDIDEQTGERITSENPEREFIKTLLTIGVERGAIKTGTETTQAGRIVTMVTLNSEHNLIKNPCHADIKLIELPEALRQQINTITNAIRELCSEEKEDEIAAAKLFYRLPNKFPKKILMVAEAIGVVGSRKVVSPKGFPVTLLRVK